jgi:hypothetical protein
VSGEKEAEQGPGFAYSSKYYVSLAQILSVRFLSVAMTAGRSRIRRNQTRTFLTLSHHNGDDGIEKSKKFPANCRVDGTGEPLTGEEEKKKKKLTRRTRKKQGG